MADKKTRDRIIETAVDMWASQSYNAVSIRDIAHAVNIRESSIYYHFKSKKDILDTIISLFEEKAASIADSLITSISESILLQSSKKQGLFHRKTNFLPSAFMWLKTFYCEQFLFDHFSNSVMRILMLEQFHDEAIAAKYNEWLFVKPRMLMLQAMGALGLVEDKSDDTYAEPFGDFLTSRIFHYLLSGTLTEDKCAQFTGELEAFVSAMFGEETIREANN